LGCGFTEEGNPADARSLHFPPQAMTLILPGHSRLMVRDAHGQYSPATTDMILAAARQAVDLKMQRGGHFGSSTIVAAYLQDMLGGLDHEVFGIIFLDLKNNFIEYSEMFRGTIDSATVHTREVVKEALRHNCSAVVISHNHPSGDLKPSAADIEMTRRLKEALALVEVRLHDHVIVGGNASASFVALGLI
jgi:DNA repair protein RadC